MIKEISLIIGDEGRKEEYLGESCLAYMQMQKAKEASVEQKETEAKS